jgi:DNA-binding transcriptional ArsR family regulator
MNMRSYKCCSLNSKESSEISKLTEVLKLLAEENRLKIFCLLGKNSCCVCEMFEPLSMSQSLLSHHLADLKKMGLIENKKTGRRVYYSLTKKGKKISKLILALRKEL